MSQLEQSWSGFSPVIAAGYLTTYGSPSLRSRELTYKLLKKVEPANGLIKIIDFGCGNGQLYQFFREQGLSCSYLGVDFSETLLDAARQAMASDANTGFIKADVEALEGVDSDFDVAIFSHVLEILSCPEQALRNAKRVARRIMIRFYEPPEFDVDTVELRQMDLYDGRTVPYIRRKMSRDYYRLILARIGCVRVDIFQAEGDKDQIHLLSFE